MTNEERQLRDAAENLLIAIGMGWDIEGCVENLRVALAQSDAAERREEELREDERLGAALRRAQDAEDRLAALAQSDTEPVCKICGGSGYIRYLGRGNSEEVENCSCRQQSDAEPVAWRWRYNEPPSGPWTLIDDRFAADRLASRSDIDVEPLYTTLPRPDASAKDVATKIASRPALAKLIDTGALQFSEMCDLRDDIEKALRSRPDASAGLIEAEFILKLVEEEPEYPGMQEEIKREIEAGFDWDELKQFPLAEVAGQAIVLGCIETKKAIATKIRGIIRARAADRSGK